MLAVTSRPPSESGPATGAAPVWSRLQGECMSCSAKPESKWRKSEGMLPIPRSGTICFRNSPGALVRFSFHEIGESPRCCPVLRGLRDRCIAAMLATRKAEVSGHAPQAAVAAPSGFQPAAARSSALTSRKWLPRMDSRHQPPGSEPGALAVALQGNTIRQPELHRSLADTSGVRRYQRFGGI